MKMRSNNVTVVWDISNPGKPRKMCDEEVNGYYERCSDSAFSGLFVVCWPYSKSNTPEIHRWTNGELNYIEFEPIILRDALAIIGRA